MNVNHKHFLIHIFYACLFLCLYPKSCGSRCQNKHIVPNAKHKLFKILYCYTLRQRDTSSFNFFPNSLENCSFNADKIWLMSRAWFQHGENLECTKLTLRSCFYILRSFLGILWSIYLCGLEAWTIFAFGYGVTQLLYETKYSGLVCMSWRRESRENMDLWVVAAATGAGYVAKYWWNLTYIQRNRKLIRNFFLVFNTWAIWIQELAAAKTRSNESLVEISLQTWQRWLLITWRRF